MQFLNQPEKCLYTYLFCSSYDMCTHFAYLYYYLFVYFFRDKLLSGTRYYSKLGRHIVQQYKELGPGTPREKSPLMLASGKSVGRAMVPSFPQFVQFLLDERARGARLDEHWIPMSEFCTPCLVPFDVFAKVGSSAVVMRVTR